MSPQLAVQILADYYDGMTLKQCFAKYGVSAASFYKYLHSNPLFEQSLARARTDLIHAEVEEAKEIADTETDAARARNRIDIRKFRASKLLSQVYGDQVTLNLNGVIDIKQALTAGFDRALSVCDQQGISDAELVDTKQLVCNSAPDSKSVPLDENAPAHSIEDLLS